MEKSFNNLEKNFKTIHSQKQEFVKSIMAIE